MIAARRDALELRLDRAVAHARELRQAAGRARGAAVRLPWASDRLHAFVLQGMADNATAPREQAPRSTTPTSSRTPGAGRGLLEALAARCGRRGDRRYPGVLPSAHARGGGRRARRAARSGRLERPVAAARPPIASSPRRSRSARFLQKTLRPHLEALSAADDPFARVRLAATCRAARRRDETVAAPRRRRSLAETPRRVARAADRSHRRASRRRAAGSAAARRGARSVPRTIASRAMPTSATSRNATRRAACRRICTSATSPRTRFSRR